MELTQSTRLLETLNKYFDELNVGDRFVTRGRTVTEADVVTFSAFSGDYHPLHTDEVWAAEGPFRTRVAHGMCTLAMATGLTFPLFATGESTMLAFYGMDHVRFVKPVFIGDTIHVEGEILSLDPKDERSGIMTLRQEIKNQHGETVVVLEQKSLLKTKTCDELAARGLEA